jgi:hypothetical protein
VSVTFLTDKRLKSATQDQTVDLIQKFESLNGLNCLDLVEQTTDGRSGGAATGSWYRVRPSYREKAS